MGGWVDGWTELDDQSMYYNSCGTNMIYRMGEHRNHGG